MKKVKLLLCCKEEKREHYRKTAEKIYGDMVELVETQEAVPDRIFVISPYQEPESVRSAAEQGVSVTYLTEDFIPMGLYEMLLRND